LCQNPFAKKLQTQIVGTEKVRKELWNEKAACKIYVKLTVMPRFFAQLLSAYYFGFVIFWRKDFGAKAAHKMSVKLTPGVNFTDIFAQKSFRQKAGVEQSAHDPKLQGSNPATENDKYANQGILKGEESLYR
jgi:hypothetical protein